MLSQKPASGLSASEPLRAFYTARRFQPAWTGGVIEQQMAREARAVLARAHEQGLSDEDYEVPADIHPGRGPEAAEYDLALSDAVLRYAHDVRTGRVQPKDIYEDAGLPASNFDAAAELAHAARNHSLTKFFADLPPPHPEYRRLPWRSQNIARSRTRGAGHR